MKGLTPLKLTLFGAAGGLIFGLVYWFTWGCRSCTRDSEPAVILGFCTIIGTAMAWFLGREHLPRRGI